MSTKARRTGPAQPLSIDLTINLTNGAEIDTEGKCEALADIGAAVQALIDSPETGLGKGERWSSLVVVIA